MTDRNDGWPDAHSLTKPQENDQRHENIKTRAESHEDIDQNTEY